MTVQDWYNKYKGQSLLVPGAVEADRGQCVQAADYWLNEGFGLPYVWANAIDWWNLPGSLAGNFDKLTTGTLKAGDFVIYSEALVKDGHIDVVAQDGELKNYIGYDSNWGGNKTLHTVTHNDKYNNYIIGWIRRKQVAKGLDEGEIAGIYQLAFDNDDYPKDIINAFMGHPTGELVTYLLQDPSYQAHKRTVNNPPTGNKFKPYTGPQLGTME